MMKRFGLSTLAIGAAFLLSMSIAACSSEEETNTDKENTAGENTPENTEQAKHDWATHDWKLAPVENGTQAKINMQMAGMMESIPAEERDPMMATMKSANDEVKATGIESKAKKAGEMAPAFTLKDTKGSEVSLSDALAKGPVVLIFFRGSWCPICNTQLADLEAAKVDIEKAGGSLITISPELADQHAWYDENFAISYPLLTDSGNKVASDFGLVFTLPESLQTLYPSFGIDLPARNGDQSMTLPMASTYVIDQDGTIAWSYGNVDYVQRAEPAHIVAVLNEIKAVHAAK